MAGPTDTGKTGGCGAARADVDEDGLPDRYIAIIREEPMADLFFRNKAEASGIMREEEVAKPEP